MQKRKCELKNYETVYFFCPDLRHLLVLVISLITSHKKLFSFQTNRTRAFEPPEGELCIHSTFTPSEKESPKGNWKNSWNATGSRLRNANTIPTSLSYVHMSRWQVTRVICSFSMVGVAFSMRMRNTSSYIKLTNQCEDLPWSWAWFSD